MFISLEGIEGSGKTTQIGHMAAYLQKTGRDYVITKEPGGTAVGEKIRSILLDPEHTDIDPMAELMLYVADRVQHVQKVILPAMASGKIVICDRFCDSTTVYQGVSRGIDTDLIQRIHHLALGGLLPDLTFVLDLNPEIGLKRAWRQIRDGSRPERETRFENERLEFHEKVRKGYLELARLEPERFVVLDAAANPEKVRETILGHLENHLKNQRQIT
ncbi:MAG: dTMP kinase [Desulfobacterales bacterium CG23_combo_of_CG06-09_8_20_14_all_51_8]|nr:MAG: dTMP kinase [Desulfobacterales bacterium CG23_combo_of_CG06-09_8_20_14_all_51_8]